MIGTYLLFKNRKKQNNNKCHLKIQTKKVNVNYQMTTMIKKISQQMTQALTTNLKSYEFKTK